MHRLQTSSRFASFILSLFTIFTFLASGVHGEDYQIPLPASEMASKEMNDEFVPIYSLAKLTTEEEDLIVAALSTGIDEDDDLVWVRPKIVPWTGDADGTMDDMYRLYREMRDDTDKWRSEFFFFLDRKCIEETKVIIADADMYTLLYAGGNTDELDKIIKEHGANIPEINEGIVEKVTFELLDRALTYGRIPANAFRSTWANLDIANMGMSEIVEMYEGGKVELYHNPQWDVSGFVEKVKIASKQFEDAKRQKADM